jgi:hypothetical protein
MPGRLLSHGIPMKVHPDEVHDGHSGGVFGEVDAVGEYPGLVRFNQFGRFFHGCPEFPGLPFAYFGVIQVQARLVHVLTPERHVSLITSEPNDCHARSRGEEIVDGKLLFALFPAIAGKPVSGFDLKI